VAAFYTKNDRFTKLGSGQAQGEKLKSEVCFRRAVVSFDPNPNNGKKNATFCAIYT
jgi:hypothetical protein